MTGSARKAELRSRKLSSLEVFFFGLVMVLGQSLLGSLVWWAILVANLLAAAGMLLYLFLSHRGLHTQGVVRRTPRFLLQLAESHLTCYHRVSHSGRFAAPAPWREPCSSPVSA